MTYLGRQGDPLDRGLIVRDLIDAGVIKILQGYTITPGAPLPIAPGDAVSGGSGADSYVVDTTPPPTPTGFTASAGITYIYIQHDVPAYTQGHGHLRTRVYGKIRGENDPLPVFNDAVEISQFTGTVHAIATNPSTTWHLWIKWETVDGYLSVSPAGGTNGLVVTTGQDVSSLLNALTGQITESQLYSTLGARINLIDGNGAGSVNARIQTETDARLAADAALQTQIDNLVAAGSGDYAALFAAINAETANRAAAILAEANARAEADNTISAALAAINASSGTNVAAIATQITTSLEVNQALARQIVAAITSINGNSAAIVAERETRISSEQASAAQVASLATNMGSSVAAFQTEQNTRSAADFSLSAQVTTTSAAVGANQAAVVSLQASSAAADSAFSSQLSGLVAVTQTATASIANEQNVRASNDSALSAQITSVSAASSSTYAELQNEIVTRANADSALSSSITTLDARLTNFGHNLLQNSSFEIDSNNNGVADGWGMYIYNNITGYSYSLSTIYKTHGSYSQRVAFSSSGGGYYDNLGIYSHIIFFNPSDVGKKLTASAYVTGTAGAYANIYLEIYDSSNNYLVNPDSSNLLNGLGTWQRISVSIPSVPGNASHGFMYVWLNRHSGPAELYIDCAQLQFGDLTGYLGNDVSAALQVEASTRASAISGIEAKYTVKVDVAGHVAGYGLIATANDATPTSSFGVRADQFFIAPPVDYNQSYTPTTPTLNQIWRNTATDEIKIWNGSAWTTFNTNLPFVVRTTGVVENGVSIPPGTYIDAAYIVNLTALNARIGQLIADDITSADINVAQLTGGTIRVGAFIQSQSYSSGVSGWRINANGSAEFNEVTVRGTVYANAGSFTGAVTATSGSIAGALTVGGSLTSGKTSYGAGTGWLLEYNSGTPRLDVGNATNYLRWNSSVLETSGLIIKNGDGVVLFSAYGSNVPPWVQSIDSISGTGIALVGPRDPVTNTVTLKSLVPGSGISIYENAEGLRLENNDFVYKLTNDVYPASTSWADVPGLVWQVEADKPIFGSMFLSVFNASGNAVDGGISFRLVTTASAAIVSASGVYAGYRQYQEGGYWYSVYLIESANFDLSREYNVRAAPGLAPNTFTGNFCLWTLSNGICKLQFRKTHSNQSPYLRHGSVFRWRTASQFIDVSGGSLAGSIASMGGNPAIKSGYSPVIYSEASLIFKTNGVMQFTRSGRSTESYSWLASGPSYNFDVRVDLVSITQESGPGYTYTQNINTWTNVNGDVVVRFGVANTAYSASTKSARFTFNILFRYRDGTVTQWFTGDPNNNSKSVVCEAVLEEYSP